jgi:hypothetical protein
MGIDFSVIDGTEYDERLVGITTKMKEAGLHFVTLSVPYSMILWAFPRDIAVVVSDDLVLVDEDLSWRQASTEDFVAISSPFGTGGRVLRAGDTMLVPDRVGNVGERHEITDEDLAMMHCMGIKTGIMPHAIVWSREYLHDDHLDRYSALIQDVHGKLHLLLDSEICSGCKMDLSGFIYSNSETISRYREKCKTLEITLHVVETKVYGSLGMVQFSDGRVLMTSGETKILGLVQDLVGKTSVFQTPEPIWAFPAFPAAGIRCLIGEIPDAWCVESETDGK